MSQEMSSVQKLGMAAFFLKNCSIWFITIIEEWRFESHTPDFDAYDIVDKS